MIRLSPLFVPCRRCDAGPGEPCVARGIVAFAKQVPHEAREADADRASELLDEELHGGERT